MKIAVFDSGIGGVTVLNELKSRFPFHDYLYYGDTANVPYGTKSPSQIKALVTHASQEIKLKKVDALVIACNTASCIALDEAVSIMGSTPVFNVVDAGVDKISRVIREHPEQAVLILGTKATIRSQSYSSHLQKIFGGSLKIFEQACPLLVPMIEEGWLDHPALHQTIQSYVEPYLGLKPGIAFLACTHYPWIKPAIEKALPGWKVMDSAALMAETLSNDSRFPVVSPDKKSGTLEWRLTDPDISSKLSELVHVSFRNQ